MATFSQKGFDSSSYHTFRPAYGNSILSIVLAYAKCTGPASTGRRIALDLGCGTGQGTKQLAEYFDEVIGADASSVMIDTGRSELVYWDDQTLASRVKFLVSSTEDIASHLEPQSVILITAGEQLERDTAPYNAVLYSYVPQDRQPITLIMLECGQRYLLFLSQAALWRSG